MTEEESNEEEIKYRNFIKGTVFETENPTYLLRPLPLDPMTKKKILARHIQENPQNFPTAESRRQAYDLLLDRVVNERARG